MEKIDFGIVTALKIEKDALVKRFEGYQRIRGIPPDIRDYFRGKLILADASKYELVAVQCTQAGNSDAGQCAKDLIIRWKPRYLIMLGVAGGYPKGDLKIGDVVIASEILEYDYKKLYDDGWKPRPRHHPIDATLLAKLSSLPEWIEYDIPAPPGESNEKWRPKLMKPGPIAAGNSVFAGEEARDRLLSLQQDLLAVEMESEGVAVAAWQRNPPIPVFVIRGICDLADFSTKGENSDIGRRDRFENEEIKKSRQITAANSAASFLFHFLSDKPIEPGDTNLQGLSRPGTEIPEMTEPKKNKNGFFSLGVAKDSSRNTEIGKKELKSIVNKKDGSILIFIESGSFLMGSTPSMLSKGGYSSNEDAPPESIHHIVHIDGFWIGKFPITNNQYRKFIEETGHDKPDRLNVPNFNGSENPVVGVSWNDAQAYLDWAGLRLPTEAEWEFTVKGPGLNDRIFPWGNEIPHENYLNYFRLHKGTTPVHQHHLGTTPKTELFDMVGNVLEWCLDDTRDYLPNKQQNPLGDIKSNYRSIRGGSFARPLNSCRNAYRDRRQINSKWGSTSFRPAKGRIID